MELVPEPTIIAEWYKLVMTASSQGNISLNKEAEAYLVFMLMRNTSNIRLFSTAAASDSLTSYTYSGKFRHLALRDTADKCVLIAGLFPGLAKRRLVRVDYFVTLAQGAYGQITDLFSRKYSEVWVGMENHVDKMVDTLMCARQPDLDKLVLRAHNESLVDHSRRH